MNELLLASPEGRVSLGSVPTLIQGNLPMPWLAERGPGTGPLPEAGTPFPGKSLIAKLLVTRKTIIDF